MSRTSNEVLLWNEWNPGLDNDHLSLGEVWGSLPAIAADKVPLIIRLFENPKSPIAFPGAIDLEAHDAIHAVLGRGLMVQDEAFVIGFTMGAARKFKPWHGSVFTWITRYLYRKPYQFSHQDLISYRLGMWEGRSQGVEDIHLFDFTAHKDRSLKDLRKDLKIDRNRLYSVYAYEKILVPDTQASQRLDVDLNNVDPSAIRPPRRGADR